MTTATNLFGDIRNLKTGEVIRAANSVDWDFAQENGEPQTGAFVDYETGETVFCDGPAEMTADMARAAFIERFEDVGAAMAFEEQVLGAGREFVPETLRSEVGESVAYWAWLTDQHAGWQHLLPIEFTAEQVAAITSGKTVLDVPAGEVLPESMPCTMWSPRLQNQPATKWADLPTEDARLLAEVESAYEAAKGTWTGRTWEDGDKITPESTDDQIASMLAREEDIKVTCWGVDESVNSWHSRVRAAVADLTVMWNRDELGERFYETMNTLREFAAESDAGVADRAAVAETDASEAIREARAGNKHSALVHAEHAAKVEREFGDAPTWGPFCEAMRAWSEHKVE